MKIILASTSPARAAILQKLNIQFTAISPDVDETPLTNETAQELTVRLAKLKALAVPADAETFVIGSDQVATLNGEIIGKPHTTEKAITQLTAFSGKTIIFYTGLALKRGNEIKTHLEKFEVIFRELTLKEIEKYLELEDVLKCAGSIKSEFLGIHLFSELKGRDGNALMGLPIIGLGELLREYNLSWLDLYSV